MCPFTHPTTSSLRNAHPYCGHIMPSVPWIEAGAIQARPLGVTVKSFCSLYVFPLPESLGAWQRLRGPVSLQLPLCSILLLVGNLKTSIEENQAVPRFSEDGHHMGHLSRAPRKPS